jgi:dTDP-4-dehydrorhamnose reductase
MKPDVLITGGGGMLAQALRRELRARGRTVHALTRQQLDVTDASAVRDVITSLHPGTIVQCAAYTAVDEAEDDEASAQLINAQAVEHVAAAAAAIGARLMYPSTDYVFNGAATTPYTPDTPVQPINAYGRSKAAGEANAARAGDFIVVRLSWLYGAGGRNFVRTIADRLDQGLPTRVVDDQRGAPAWTVDAARALALLMEPHVEPGIYHWCNAGVASWFDVATEIARAHGRPELVTPCSSAEYPTRAKRPVYSVLDCSETIRITGVARDWRSALADALRAASY